MKKFELEVVQDTDPESPRTWDNLGTMVCFHKRYELGDKTDYRTEDYDQSSETCLACSRITDVHVP